MKHLLMAACAVAVVGCKNVAPDADQDAVIVNPTDASKVALKQAVDAALGTDVALADNALTVSSALIIERNIPQSIEGSPAQGRTMDMPIRFNLVTDGTDCVLIDTRNNSRHVLANTECVAQ